MRLLLRVWQGPFRGEGVVDVDPDGAAVALLPGLPEARPTTLDALAEWIAACVGLGPRPPAPAATRIVPRARIADEAGRADAHWTLWTDDRAVEVYDAGTLWLVAPADPAVLAAEDVDAMDDPVALRPASATEIWLALSTVLRASMASCGDDGRPATA